MIYVLISIGHTKINKETWTEETALWRTHEVHGIKNLKIIWKQLILSILIYFRQFRMQNISDVFDIITPEITYLLRDSMKYLHLGKWGRRGEKKKILFPINSLATAAGCNKKRQNYSTHASPLPSTLERATQIRLISQLKSVNCC